MKPFLSHIEIENFRSIKGRVSVPLDAPVVLIHGHNGAGKTSLLSALELGLTGTVESLARLDSTFYEHLVHKSAAEGSVTVTAETSGGGKTANEVRVVNTQIIGRSLLTREQSHFFSERCYLAQSTLGRLLEIYERKEKKGESPLTKFVKDLLGLDQFDALLEGLHHIGDTRRIRAAIPEYAIIMDQIQESQAQVTDLQSSLKELETSANAVETSLNVKLASLGIYDSSSPEIAIRALESTNEEAQLQRYAGHRREIVVSREQLSSLRNRVSDDSRKRAEASLDAANAELLKWKLTGALEVAAYFDSLKALFPDHTAPEVIGYTEFLGQAIQRIESDIQRCDELSRSQTSFNVKLDDLFRTLRQLDARSFRIDEQIAQHSAQSSEMAVALANLLPHINSDNCPVCDRDFTEVKKGGLQSHVNRQVTALTKSADQLQALMQEKANATKSRGDFDRERAILQSQLISPEQAIELKARVFKLNTLLQRSSSLKDRCSEGDRIISASSAAARELASMRTADQSNEVLRESTRAIASRLHLDIAESEGLDSALSRLSTVVLQNEAVLIERQATRKEALEEARVLVENLATKKRLNDKLGAESLRLRKLKRSLKIADQKVSSARKLAKRTAAVKAEIVRRVFNDSLNSIWRDLFIRLAPDEQFVPAFAVPSGATRLVEAILETNYRNGEKGGNPKIMLSAGNLNTAALTLFVALHLSVNPEIRCLIIDDPVQSMDEVHIAQFAALLRTLSKQMRRQIIVAVHERALFEYLALELSPTFEGDKLITIQLSRATSDTTVAEYELIGWRPEFAIAAE